MDGIGDHQQSHPIFISAESVSKVLSFENLIPAIERGLATFSRRTEDEIKQPVRTVITIPERSGLFCTMPVYSKVDNVIATKIVSFFPKNTEVPTHNAVVLVFSTKTGVLRAMLDGDIITRDRTAAASAVATKYLVNGQPKILAILGSGVQARSHYAAISHLFTFDKVNIWNRRVEGAQKFAKDIGPTAEAFANAEDAVKDADIIVTATSSSVPVLKAEWVKPGAHINSVGACHATMQEIDPQLMRECVVYVDSREGALKESGDVILSKAEIHAEVGEMINDPTLAQPGKTTLFKSLGMAIEDAVAAKLVVDKLKIP